VDAHAALRAAMETTQPEISAKKLVVVRDWRAQHTTIRADNVRLQQILWNVLKNAAKFTPEGGMIRVGTEDRESGLVIEISDTGVGMEPTELNRVFEAFAQGNHARANSGHRFGGLGLGLAISRRLVELHGGTIAAASAGPGTGATFTLTLPVSRQPASPEPSSPLGRRAPRNGQIKRLLIVEDHAATRISLMRMMERRGYVVQGAGSLAQARELAATETFDLVLSDLGLPDGSGHELMMELGERTGIPGIALSGFGMETDVSESKLAGFVAHLTKPVTAQALDAAMERIARAHSDPSPR
jgi:CheY-like chemotaxis protein